MFSTSVSVKVGILIRHEEYRPITRGVSSATHCSRARPTKRGCFNAGIYAARGGVAKGLRQMPAGETEASGHARSRESQLRRLALIEIVNKSSVKCFASYS